MTRAKDRDGIQKLGTQHYRVVLELPRTPEGKRQRIQRSVRGTLEEARALQVELRDRQRKGLLVGNPDQTLSEYLTSWLDSKAGTTSARTIQRYGSLCRSISRGIGSVRLGDLTTQHINDYYVACRSEVARPVRKASHRKPKPTGQKPRLLSPTTVHHRHVVLKMALKEATEDGIIPRNPADKAAAPRSARRVLHLINESEAALLLDTTLGTPAEGIVSLALFTGARLGELLALRWQDLDLDRQTMHVRRTLVEQLKRSEGDDWFAFKEPKSGRGRSVDLDAATVERLRGAKRAQAEHRLTLGAAWRGFDLVFASLNGEPLRPSGVSARFRALAESVGVEGVRFHDLRHGHATMLLRQGFAPHVVSRRLGHSDPATTLRIYAGVLPGQEREAAEAFAASLERAQKAL